ncbi:hypothetical protein [Knoellia aerolata]|uniref:hypothetical protein n=1 Tax=Knoellia aerolata TaxID=442954 RepID=UPI0012EDE998|nr:hypothetical protein [Knoellia aerolata]
MLDDFTTASRRSRADVHGRGPWGRRILVVLGSVVALAVVAGSGFALYVKQRVSANITQEGLLPKAAPPDTTAPDGSTATAAPKAIGTNYLVIGSDALPGQSASSWCTSRRTSSPPT